MRLALILLVVPAAVLGCATVKHGDWASTPTLDRPQQPRGCRLLYKRDWSDTWLECRQCFQMGKVVECP